MSSVGKATAQDRMGYAVLPGRHRLSPDEVAHVRQFLRITPEALQGPPTGWNFIPHVVRLHLRVLRMLSVRAQLWEAYLQCCCSVTLSLERTYLHGWQTTCVSCCCSSSRR